MNGIPLSASEQEQILQTAHLMADAARAVTLKYFRQKGLGAENKRKEDFDPVTVADRDAEKAMRDILAERRPEDAIFGEEHGEKSGTSGLTWVLDPIDGTRGFISGTPTWGVLIGLRDAAKVHLGLVDQPYIGERFLGAFGKASMIGPHGEVDLCAGRAKTLDEAIIFTTFPEVGSEHEAKTFHRLAQQCKLTRYGMDCYAYALLAAGQVDLVVEAGLQSYDILGPIGLIEAAGGIVTNWQGEPALDGGQVVAAGTPELHKMALEKLAQR